MCSCLPNYEGNAFVQCRPIQGLFEKDSSFGRCYNGCVLALPVADPCSPNPCGPNSQCREINGQAVCSCVPGFIGSPPTCRPECVVNSECPLNEACNNQKCKDPCPGTCGISARCEVVSHNPICSCPPRFSGDPFIRCSPIRKHKIKTLLLLQINKNKTSFYSIRARNTKRSMPTFTMWSKCSL